MGGRLELEPCGRAPTTAIGRQHHRWMPAPDQRIAGDRREIAEVHGRHAIPKGRTVPIEGIGDDPSGGNAPTCDRLLEQGQRDGRLALEGQRERNSCAGTLIGVVVSKPGFGDEQLTIDERVAFGTGIAQIDADLAIGDLADRSTLLRGDVGRRWGPRAAILHPKGRSDKRAVVFVVAAAWLFRLSRP